MAFSVNVDGGGSAASVTLSGNNLVVPAVTQVQTDRSPSPKVASGVDGTADGSSGVLLGVANRPELLEGLCAVDGWLVVSRGLEDIIGRAVAGHGSLPLSGRRGVVTTVGFDDVVLNERVTGPTIDSKVAVTVWLVVTVVVDDPIRAMLANTLVGYISNNSIPSVVSGVPSLSTDEIAVRARPLNGILASVLVGVSRLGVVVRPPGVVVAAVSASRAGSTTTSLKHRKAFGRVCRHGEGTDGDGGGSDEGSERHHIEE